MRRPGLLPYVRRGEGCFWPADRSSSLEIQNRLCSKRHLKLLGAARRFHPPAACFSPFRGVEPLVAVRPGPELDGEPFALARLVDEVLDAGVGEAVTGGGQLAARRHCREVHSPGEAPSLA